MDATVEICDVDSDGWDASDRATDDGKRGGDEGSVGEGEGVEVGESSKSRTLTQLDILETSRSDS